MKFAAITNYREPAKNIAEAPSRGEILQNYLTGELDAGEYIKLLCTNGSRYNGFNLILGDSEDLYYYSNRSVGPQRLAPGFYGLSNQLLDVPWPKVVRGKELLRPYMLKTSRIDPLQLLAQLEDKHCPPDEQLPDTKVGLEWERLLSTIFIDGTDYGTRSSAVITVTDEGRIEFVEKTIKRSPSKSATGQLVHHCLNG